MYAGTVPTLAGDRSGGEEEMGPVRGVHPRRGGDHPLLHEQIKEPPGKFRGALAVEAVKALALNGSSPALLLVDQIARKFKYRQVKKGAADALAGAAARLGISREELEDRIVPDLGFDERMERTFDYGSRRFTVRLTLSLEAEVYGEDGKRLKNLPSPENRMIRRRRMRPIMRSKR